MFEAFEWLLTGPQKKKVAVIWSGGDVQPEDPNAPGTATAEAPPKRKRLKVISSEPKSTAGKRSAQLLLAIRGTFYGFWRTATILQLALPSEPISRSSAAMSLRLVGYSWQAERTTCSRILCSPGFFGINLAWLAGNLITIKQPRHAKLPRS